MPVRHLHQTLLRILSTIVLFLLELTVVAQIQALRVNINGGRNHHSLKNSIFSFTIWKVLFEVVSQI